jgi:predicted DCC family thiol-disulfide oxidoreductase YuxK
VKWVVWLAHLSYAQRNPAITYGVDSILSSLLLILCIAPIGHNLSLDRVREIRRTKKQNLDTVPPRFISAWGYACMRLIQIQMAVLYFFSAIDKLQGKMWWSGDALWVAINNFEFNNIPTDWLAEHYWLVNIMTYATLITEMGYFFLIWDKRSRPYFLVGAYLLHIGIAVFMGLYFFASVMIAGHSIFLHHDWLATWGEKWRKKFGNMEMIYDGDCGFCRRSMEWFLGFDGLGQIKTRNFRTDPSLLVTNEQLEQALYLITAEGRRLPGFEAYRYAVLRVPGMWWMIPLFYIPLLSRAVGQPLYNWVAKNRQRVSRRIGSASCKIQEN